MARWFIYQVLWHRGIPPLARNLAVANRRLQREDWDAPLLTEDGFVERVEPMQGVGFAGCYHVLPRRWRSPILTARDVYCILTESNANPSRVIRWECRCEDWSACDAGLTKCYARHAYRGEDATTDYCSFYIIESERGHPRCREKRRGLDAEPIHRLPYKKNPSIFRLRKRR